MDNIDIFIFIIAIIMPFCAVFFGHSALAGLILIFFVLLMFILFLNYIDVYQYKQDSKKFHRLVNRIDYYQTIGRIDKEVCLIKRRKKTTLDTLTYEIKEKNEVYIE